MNNRDHDLTKLISEWLGNMEDPHEEESATIQADKALFSEEHGSVAIVDGKLIMKKPGRGGKWPTITAEKDGLVKIFYRREEIERTLVLEDVGEIDLEIIQKLSDNSFEIVISPDKLEIWLFTEFTLGAEYQIADSDFTSDLVITAKKMRTLPAKPIDQEEVYRELKELGIKPDLLRKDIIARACTEGNSGKFVIGVGIPAKPPVDGRIESPYNLTGKMKSKEKHEDDIWSGRRKVESVEPGEVVAYWHRPSPGQPGMDVFGKTILPKTPKWDRFEAGPGVRLVEDGTVAVAEIAGRPCLELGQICVKPELFISSDVEVATGSIDFTGDVVISGDVKESAKIKAGGRVDVRGGVYHGEIVAGSHVTVERSIIGGHLIVGGEIANGIEIMSLISNAVGLLEKLQTVFVQLQTHPRFSTDDLKKRGDGYLIKLILETRLEEIPKLFNKLASLLPNEKELRPNVEVDKVWQILHQICRRFLGINPLNIKSVSEVHTIQKGLKRIHSVLEDLVVFPADIHVEYCQNASLEASGNIIVFGSLVYSCTMNAGQSIRISGSCRGGSYFARNSIEIRSAGINETVKTYLSTGEGGRIQGETFYPGVEINIGQAKKSIVEVKHNVQFSFEQGQWVERNWKRG